MHKMASNRLLRNCTLPSSSCSGCTSRDAPYNDCDSREAGCCEGAAVSALCSRLNSRSLSSSSHAATSDNSPSLGLESRNSQCARGGGLGSRPKQMYGERLVDGVEYHLMSPTPRCYVPLTTGRRAH